MSNLEIRPLGFGEADLFLSYPHPPVPGVGVESRRSYREVLEGNQYRPEWSWVALRDGAVVARCAFWGFPDATHPYSLDWLEPGHEPDRVEIAAELLRVAVARMLGPDGARPEYHLFLPPAWRDDPVTAQAAQDRLTAAARAGYEPFVERFSYTWTPDDPAPKRSGRLVFREVDDAEAIGICLASCEGTLDGYTNRDVARHGAAEAARIMVADLAEFPSPRSWWRAAHTPEGELVGLIVPARNHTRATVGYITVVPSQRGRGYVDELLAEITAILVEQGADDIGADTDLGNRPMAAAFARAGYRNTAIRVVLQ